MHLVLEEEATEKKGSKKKGASWIMKHRKDLWCSLLFIRNCFKP